MASVTTTKNSEAYGAQELKVTACDRNNRYRLIMKNERTFPSANVLFYDRRRNILTSSTNAKASPILLTRKEPDMNDSAVVVIHLLLCRTTYFLAVGTVCRSVGSSDISATADKVGRFILSVSKNWRMSIYCTCRTAGIRRAQSGKDDRYATA